MERIASFTVDHDFIVPGMYISRIDGDLTTYDLRTRRPNCGEYMSNLTMHSVEHMFATVIRNSSIKDNVIYFGPMGCQTGFYLITRDLQPSVVYKAVTEALLQIVQKETIMYGAERRECGNYKNLDLNAAKAECKSYLEALKERGENFEYPKE